MRRADRLFEILQILRRRTSARAADIADALEVSRRTIYRDIRDLMANGVPIDGAAGVGYILRPGFDLPPLMFTEHQLEALVLGARIVESWADPELAKAAADAITKIRTVVPEVHRRHLDGVTLRAPADHFSEPVQVDRAELRRAIRASLKIQFGYRDGDGRVTERCVRPLLLAFYGPVWLMPSWCELRRDFRVFRLDRMSALAVLDQPFRAERGKTALDFLQQDTTRHGMRRAVGDVGTIWRPLPP
jgi:predicted DNA-binding transcriptional regulator YafY